MHPIIIRQVDVLVADKTIDKNKHDSHVIDAKSLSQLYVQHVHDNRNNQQLISQLLKQHRTGIKGNIHYLKKLKVQRFVVDVMTVNV